MYGSILIIIAILCLTNLCCIVYNRKIMIKNTIFQECIIDVLMTTLNKKSYYTWRHSLNVSRYVKIIANKFNFSKTDMNIIIWAAMLHDIGKIAISNDILDKPAKLSNEEYMEIKKHPIYGKEIIMKIYKEKVGFFNIKTFYIIADIISFHHERWDGEGYPYGKKEIQIPLLARIVSLADAWDAMIGERPYKEPFSKQEAIEEIQRCSGTQFDPKIVDVFMQCINENLL